MNIEKLITEVFKQQCLWNQAHPDHHNRFVLEKKWGEVSFILGTTKDVVKSKWKYLRDTFRKELAKCPKPRSGDEGGVPILPKWGYFKSLLFLKDQFTPRKSSSNLSSCASSEMAIIISPASVDEGSQPVDEGSQPVNEGIFYSQPVDEGIFYSQPANDNDDTGVDEDDSQVDSDVPSTAQASTSSLINEPPSNEPRVAIASRNRKRKIPEDVLGQTLLNVEREKLKLLKNKFEHKPVDEDRSFFESILPHVQKIEPLQKLQFRMKVQELVMRYAYNSVPPSNGTSPIPE